MPLRYAAERDKKYRILDLTSLTVEEFETLVQAFETGFLADMQDWTLEGKPRTGRRYSQYANCPLPSAEDQLLFILSDTYEGSVHDKPIADATPYPLPDGSELI